jgi:hypothetical protein
VNPPIPVPAPMTAARMTTSGNPTIIPKTIPQAAWPLLWAYLVMSGWIVAPTA